MYSVKLIFERPSDSAGGNAKVGNVSQTLCVHVVVYYYKKSFVGCLKRET